MKKIIVIVLLLANSFCFAGEVSVGRYELANTEPSKAQRFPLVEVRSEAIPMNIRLTGEAVDFILMRTGYEQAAYEVRSPQDVALMSKPLALANRELVNLPVIEMLSIIAGLGYKPVVDPINRLVAFEAVYEFE